MKKLTVMVIALVLPMVLIAQSSAIKNFQSKYKDNDDATYVTITGPFFKFLSSITDYDADPDALALGRVVEGIKSMKIVQVPYYETDLKREEVDQLLNSIQKDNYEELINVRDGRDKVSIMAQGEDSKLRNILIFIDNKNEFTLMNIDGTLSMEDIAYLSKHHKNFHK